MPKTDLELQIEQFKKGFPAIQLDRPAVVGDGIVCFSATETERLVRLYEQSAEQMDTVKFTPASGAATRMFKHIFQGLEQLRNQEEINDDADHFLENISQFAFSEELDRCIKDAGIDEAALDDLERKKVRLSFVLESKGLNLGQLPKGLVKFHKYASHVETAFEVHFKEGLEYAKKGGGVKLHFTISPDHKPAFEQLGTHLIQKYSSNGDFKVDFSVQSKSTDTYAVYDDFTPVKKADGDFLRRPAGHGALLENLNQLKADLVFIKNIDNVTTTTISEENALYKKLLAGHLMEIKEQIFFALNQLDTVDGLKKGIELCAELLKVEVSSADEVNRWLNRPIRVCGMVKNTGEPGGGPFWVRNEEGKKSLQIVEKAQIDIHNEAQKEMLVSSTHFNPVDLVCWVTNYKGEQFDLLNYRDMNTGFITEKTYNGKSIKAMELPGLWNGAMADWITVFVEVPLQTFNPVKTVLDLLKPNHRML